MISHKSFSISLITFTAIASFAFQAHAAEPKRQAQPVAGKAAEARQSNKGQRPDAASVARPKRGEAQTVEVGGGGRVNASGTTVVINRELALRPTGKTATADGSLANGGSSNAVNLNGQRLRAAVGNGGTVIDNTRVRLVGGREQQVTLGGNTANGGGNNAVTGNVTKASAGNGGTVVDNRDVDVKGGRKSTVVIGGDSANGGNNNSITGAGTAGNGGTVIDNRDGDVKTGRKSTVVIGGDTANGGTGNKVGSGTANQGGTVIDDRDLDIKTGNKSKITIGASTATGAGGTVIDDRDITIDKGRNRTINIEKNTAANVKDTRDIVIPVGKGDVITFGGQVVQADRGDTVVIKNGQVTVIDK